MKSNNRLSRKTLRRTEREGVCWNCFQKGHLRFQCPYPKRKFCSYCRAPNVMTSECNCQSNEIIAPENIQEIIPPIEEFENIQVQIHYVQEDDDQDILEICAEDEPLE